MVIALVIFGAALNVLGTSWYVRNTLRGATKPNRMTWLMWTIAPFIGSAAAFSTGVTWAVLPVFIAGLMPLMVFIASFVNPNAYWKLQSLDYVCGALSILALVLWASTGEPLIALVLSIASDLLAGIPTLIKAWKYSETETASGYSASAISNLFGLFAVQQWTFIAYGFPLYLAVFNSLLALGILRKRIRI